MKKAISKELLLRAKYKVKRYGPHEYGGCFTPAEALALYDSNSIVIFKHNTFSLAKIEYFREKFKNGISGLCWFYFDGINFPDKDLIPHDPRKR